MNPRPVMPGGARPFSPTEKARLAAEIVVAYVRASAIMRRLALRDAVARVRRVQPASLTPHADVPAGLRLGQVVLRTLGALPTDSRCLVHALVLSDLLARRSIAGSVVIGVRTQPTFAAHAWVECQGTALLPPGEATMERIAEV